MNTFKSYLSVFIVSIAVLFSGCSVGSEEVKAPLIQNYYDSTFVVNGEQDTIRKKYQFPVEYQYIQVNDIPPRFQWNGNSGYCGEVATISAGLYFGQYVSQYDVRQLVYMLDSCPPQGGCQTPPKCKTNQGDEFLLGATTIGGVLDSLRLDHLEPYVNNDSIAFIKWVKRNVALGHPVIIGVMNNVRALGEDTSYTAGQPDYDHIVPVIGFASKHPLLQDGEAKYYKDDIIMFSDNGIYTPGTVCENIECLPFPSSCVPYYMYASLDTIFKTRVEANTKGVYALPILNSQDTVYYYGLAITGISVEKGYKPVPVRINTSINYEATCNGDTCCIYQGSALNQNTILNKRPKPNKITLTITISDLEIGKTYELYRYNDERCVPRKFDCHNIGSPLKDLTYTFKANAKSHTIMREIWSDEKVFFRAVQK